MTGHVARDPFPHAAADKACARGGNRGPWSCSRRTRCEQVVITNRAEELGRPGAARDSVGVTQTSTDAAPGPERTDGPAVVPHSRLEDVFGVLAGTYLVSFGVFLLGQVSAATGGVAGLALVLSYAGPWGFGIVFLLVNLPFFVLAWVRKGRQFTIRSVVSVALVAAFSAAHPQLFDVSGVDPVYAVLTGDLVIGIGLLIVFRHGSSLGGFNIVALLAQERLGWRAGYVQMALDVAVVVSALAVVAPSLVLDLRRRRRGPQPRARPEPPSGAIPRRLSRPTDLSAAGRRPAAPPRPTQEFPVPLDGPPVSPPVSEPVTEPVRKHDEHSVAAALRSPSVLRREVVAGLVVALALIPEAISFSIIAGVDPRLGLFASFTMAVSIAFLGGRPAMISAATGAVALVIAPVAREYGVDYFIATVILAGVFQVLLAVSGVARMMRFVPRSVMVGFVNALAILILLAQLPHLVDVPVLVYPMVAVGIALMVLLPKVTNAVPAPLVAIVLLTAVTLTVGLALPDVGDEGELPQTLPSLLWPDVPLTGETFRIIAPYALAMALVGLLESLLTAKLVDDLTDTGSDKKREAWGQGAANVISGFFGGMGGCAMIGQTMINVRASAARTRISTFCAGLFLLVLVVGFGDIVARIPMAALVAVMVMVAVGTFDWHSIQLGTLRRMPKSETTVMVSTVVVTVWTHNLAVGVVVGVLVAMALFARRVAHLVSVERDLVEHEDGSTHACYTVTGELFFASSNVLDEQFAYADDPDRVVIDLARSHVWDASTVAVLDGITTRYERRGKSVEIRGLNEPSDRMHTRLTGQLAT